MKNRKQYIPPKKEKKLKYIVQEVWRGMSEDDPIIKYSSFDTRTQAVEYSIRLGQKPEIITAIIYKARAIKENETQIDILAYLKESTQEEATDLAGKAFAHIATTELN